MPGDSLLRLLGCNGMLPRFVPTVRSETGESNCNVAPLVVGCRLTTVVIEMAR